MKRLIITLFLALACVVQPYAQQRKQSAAAKPRTAQSRQQQRQPQKSKATTAKAKGKQRKGKKSSTPQQPQTQAIKDLKKQHADVQKKLQEQQQLLKANKADVKTRLDNLVSINSEISEQQRKLEGIQQDITHIEGNIDLLKAQLRTLEEQLKERRQKYVKSLRYLSRNRGVQDQLMFVFSAKNLAQMYRRMRFVRDYAAFQRAQGEQVIQKQQQLKAKRKELSQVIGKKNSLLSSGQKAQQVLQDKKQEQQRIVSTLQRQQKTIQGIIDDQQKKAAQLNAEIDRLVAIEVEKARVRAAEEAKRKAAEAAAAKKKRQEELARKRAAAEAAARENERRIAEAKAREQRAKAEAREAAKKDREAKERAEREALRAQADREAAERKAQAEKRRHDKEIAQAKKESEEALTMSTTDRKLSNNFESNRGRLPMPITGPCRIVSHYGQYNVEGLKNVTLDNKGINIRGQAGAQARAIFDGEVSAVFSLDGQHVVMVRHGSYISVYCNLRSVSVSRGQHVSTRQALGTVGTDNILQFQLRKETKKLNPEVWIGR